MDPPKVFTAWIPTRLLDFCQGRRGWVAFKMGTVFLGASRQLDAHTTYISYLDLPVWVHLQKKCFRAKKVSIHHPQKGCFRWYPDSKVLVCID